MKRRTAPVNLNSNPVFFGIQGITAFEHGEGFVTECRICRRTCCAPHRFQRQVVWCLYCGMERGHVPMVEVPIGANEFSFGITKEECDMIHGWIADPCVDLDSMLMRKARRHGHVLDFFA